MSPEEIKQRLLQQRYFIKYGDVRPAKFSCCNLRGVDFSNLTLCDVDFSGADLEGAKFNYSDLYLANFSFANLKCADFTSTLCFSSANFTNANLAGIYLKNHPHNATIHACFYR